MSDIKMSLANNDVAIPSIPTLPGSGKFVFRSGFVCFEKKTGDIVVHEHQVTKEVHLPEALCEWVLKPGGDETNLIPVMESFEVDREVSFELRS